MIIRDGQEDSIDLTENDLVFITNGECVENSSYSDQDKPASFNKEIRPGGGWDMWRKIEADVLWSSGCKFCLCSEQSNWMILQ